MYCEQRTATLRDLVTAGDLCLSIHSEAPSLADFRRCNCPCIILMFLSLASSFLNKCRDRNENCSVCGTEKAMPTQSPPTCATPRVSRVTPQLTLAHEPWKSQRIHNLRAPR